MARRAGWLLLLSGLAACQGDAPLPAPVTTSASLAAPPVLTDRATPATPVRYLALGDSYTIGEGVPEQRRWPVQLARLLRGEGWNVEPPHIIARTGWTSGELLEAMEAARPEGPFQLVTLLVGVNDQYRGHTPDALRENLRLLLERAVGLGGGHAGRVVLVSIPDWGRTAFGRGEDRARIGREIDAMNAVCREEAARAQVGFVDVTGLSREAGDDPEQLAADGLHPSGKAYAAWVRVLLPFARQALQRTAGE